MIVTCPSCASRYKVPVERMETRTAKVTCRQCNHRFVVALDAALPAPGAITPKPVPGADISKLDFSEVGISWQVRRNGRVAHRFYDLASLQEHLQDGKVERRDQLSFDGSEWRQISSIDRLDDYFWDVFQRARRGEITPVSNIREDEDESDAPTTHDPRGPVLNRPSDPSNGTPSDSDSSDSDDPLRETPRMDVTPGTVTNAPPPAARPGRMPSWMPTKPVVPPSQEPTVTAGPEILAAIRDEENATRPSTSRTSAGRGRSWRGITGTGDPPALVQRTAWAPKSPLPYAVLGFGTVVLSAVSLVAALYSMGWLESEPPPDPDQPIAPATAAHAPEPPAEAAPPEAEPAKPRSAPKAAPAPPPPAAPPPAPAIAAAPAPAPAAAPAPAPKKPVKSSKPKATPAPEAAPAPAPDPAPSFDAGPPAAPAPTGDPAPADAGNTTAEPPSPATPPEASGSGPG